MAMAIACGSADAQTIKTIAGNMTTGNTGDGGPASAALLNKPYGVAVDPAGNVYIADTRNSRIRKVNTSGVISAFAGTGVNGGSGNGGPATAATFMTPYGIAADGPGNVYVGDHTTNEIRKVSGTGTVFHTVGTGTACMGGDGGPATAGGVSRPWGLAVDNHDNVYIADYSNNRIRKVNVSTGIINTIAGNELYGYSGDGGPALDAKLSGPTGVAVDAAGNVYIADAGNFRIRMINTAGIITTVVGNGTNGTDGDGGQATDAQLKLPRSVAVDVMGNIYVADEATSRIRMVNKATGILTTIAGGNGWGHTGDGGAATAAKMGWPTSIVLDAACNIYVADNGSSTVRKIGAVVTPPTSFTQVAAVGDISIFPNPSNGTFSISVPGVSRSVEIVVTDIYGRVVEHRKLSNTTDISTEITLQNAARGTYMLKVTADDKSYFGKVVVAGQ